MALWQGRSKKKETGGKYWPSRKKRGSEMGLNPVYTKLGENIKQRVKSLARSYKKTNKKTGLSSLET